MPFTDFSHYVDVTAGTLTGSVTNPTAWIDLQRAPAAFWTNLAQTDGDDIIVTNSDGSTRFPAYVAYIDTTAQKGLVVARGSTIATSTVFRIYFGDADATAPAVGAEFGRNNTFQDFEAAINMTAHSSFVVEDMTGSGHTGTMDNTSAFSNDTTTAAFWGAGVRLDRSISTSASINLATSTGLDGDTTSLRTIIIAQYAFTEGSNFDIMGVDGANRIRNTLGNYQMRFGGINYLGGAGPTTLTEEVHAFTYDGSGDTAKHFINGTSSSTSSGVTAAWPSGNWALMNAGQTLTSANDAGWYAFLWANSVLADDHIAAVTKMWRDNASNFWSWGTVTSNATGGTPTAGAVSFGDQYSGAVSFGSQYSGAVSFGAQYSGAVSLG